MNTFDLTGLLAHHPLGFLAACGLFRCIAEGKQFGSCRLLWRPAEGAGGFAAINSEQPFDLDSVTQMLVANCKKQRESLAWTWSAKIDSKAKYRDASKQTLETLFEGATRDSADMLAALASDLAADGDKLRSTMFDLTSGNQSLLHSFRTLAEPGKTTGGPAPLTKDAVQEALLGPWKYQDHHHSLGWDPQVQRIHALRGKLPEKDKTNRSVRASVFLASQALPLFPCFVVGNRLRTTGFDRHDEEDWFVWPVWREPISIDALRSLLAHPFGSDLRERGVDIVYQCRRTHTGGAEGNYQIFSHAEERPWPLSRRHNSRRSAGR